MPAVDVVDTNLQTSLDRNAPDSPIHHHIDVDLAVVQQNQHTNAHNRSVAGDEGLTVQFGTGA